MKVNATISSANSLKQRLDLDLEPSEHIPAEGITYPLNEVELQDAAKANESCENHHLDKFLLTSWKIGDIGFNGTFFLAQSLKRIQLHLNRLTLPVSVQFSCNVEFNIKKMLVLPRGIELTGLKEIYISSAKLRKAGAKVLAGSLLQMTCQELNNELGVCSANGPMKIASERVLNGKGLFVSNRGAIEWNYSGDGFFDNQQGELLAHEDIRCRPLVEQAPEEFGRLLNQHGQIKSSTGELLVRFAELNNSHGSIEAQRYDVQLFRLNNALGQMLAWENFKLRTAENLNNFSGLIRAGQLDLEIQNLLVNSGGDLDAINWLKCSAKRYELKSVDRDGETVISSIGVETGDVNLRSQEVLPLGGEFYTGGQLLLTSPEGFTTDSRIIFSSGRDAILSCERGPGDIEVANADVDSQQLQLLAPKGSVAVAQLRGRASVLTQARATANFQGLDIETDSRGVEVDIAPGGEIRVTKSKIQGDGALKLGTRSPQGENHMLACERLEVRDNAVAQDNSQLNAKQVQWHDNRFRVKSKFEIQAQELVFEDQLIHNEVNHLIGKLEHFQSRKEKEGKLKPVFDFALRRAGGCVKLIQKAFGFNSFYHHLMASAASLMVQQKVESFEPSDFTSAIDKQKFADENSVLAGEIEIDADEATLTSTSMHANKTFKWVGEKFTGEKTALAAVEKIDIAMRDRLNINLTKLSSKEVSCESPNMKIGYCEMNGSVVTLSAIRELAIERSNLNAERLALSCRWLKVFDNTFIGYESLKVSSWLKLGWGNNYKSNKKTINICAADLEVDSQSDARLAMQLEALSLKFLNETNTSLGTARIGIGLLEFANSQSSGILLNLIVAAFSSHKSTNSVLSTSLTLLAKQILSNHESFFNFAASFYDQIFKRSLNQSGISYLYSHKKNVVVAESSLKGVITRLIAPEGDVKKESTQIQLDWLRSSGNRITGEGARINARVAEVFSSERDIRLGDFHYKGKKLVLASANGVVDVQNAHWGCLQAIIAGKAIDASGVLAKVGALRMKSHQGDISLDRGQVIGDVLDVQAPAGSATANSASLDVKQIEMRGQSNQTQDLHAKFETMDVQADHGNNQFDGSVLSGERARFDAQNGLNLGRDVMLNVKDIEVDGKGYDLSNAHGEVGILQAKSRGDQASLDHSAIRGQVLKMWAIGSPASAKEAQWMVKEIDVTGQGIEAYKIYTDSEKAMFRSHQGDIHLEESQQLGKAIQLRADGQLHAANSLWDAENIATQGQSVDLNRGKIRGLQHHRGQRVTLRDAEVISNQKGSAISAPIIETNHGTKFRGAGGFKLLTDNETLFGSSELGDKLEVDTSSPIFLNFHRSESNALDVRAAGPTFNFAALSANDTEVSAKGCLFNFMPITGFNREKLNVNGILQLFQGKLSSNNLAIHQRDPVITSQLGPHEAHNSMQLQSDSRVIVDRRLNASRNLDISSKNRAEKVHIQVPINVLGKLRLDGKGIAMDAEIQAGGGLDLGSRQIVEMNEDVDVKGQFNVEGPVFQNNSKTLRVQGDSHYGVDRVVWKSSYVHSQEPGADGGAGPDRALSVHRARGFHDGKVTFGDNTTLQNVGGEFLGSQDADLSGVKVANTNLSHTHTWWECIGFKRKKTFGVSRGKEYIHQERTKEIIDAAGVIDFNRALNFDSRSEILNHGAIRGGSLSGPMNSLKLLPNGNYGRASLSPEPRTGLPLGTLFGRDFCDLRVLNHSDIAGRLQSGGHLNFSTNTLDHYRRQVDELSPTIESRWCKSHKVRWHQTTHFDEGGEIIAGGKANVTVGGKAWHRAATIQAADDLNYLAQSAEFLCGENRAVVPLMPSDTFTLSSQKNAVHTTFYQTRFTSGKVATIAVTDRALMSGSEIIGQTGVNHNFGRLEMQVPMAINTLTRGRGLFGGIETNVGVAAIPRILSPEGMVRSQTETSADYAGDIVGAKGVILQSNDAARFNTASQAITQKSANWSFDGMSFKWRRETSEQLHAVTPRVLGERVEIHSGEAIRGLGAQAISQRTTWLNAPEVEWLDQPYTLRARVQGGELGISFTGSQALKTLLKDGKGAQAAKELILSDPLVHRAFNLIAAKEGEEMALASVMALAEGWKGANGLSLARETGAYGKFLGQRLELLDGEGKLHPKVKLYLQRYEKRLVIHSSLPGALSAGEQLTVTADRHRYTGSDLLAPKMAFTGQDGKKAQIEFGSSLQEEIACEEGQGASLSLETSSALVPGTEASHSRYYAKTHRKTQVVAEEIDWNAKGVNAPGANIHAERHTGVIDELNITSPLDTQQAHSWHSGADKSGKLTYGKRVLDRATAAESTFTAKDASDLQVGHAHLKGAALVNVNPASVTGEDVAEHHIERRWNLTINAGEVSSLLREMGGRRNPDDPQELQRAIENLAVDPRMLPPFRNLGSANWYSAEGRGLARATLVGATALHTLNDDLARFHIPMEIRERRGEIDFLIPNVDTIRRQWQALTDADWKSKAAAERQLATLRQILVEKIQEPEWKAFLEQLDQVCKNFQTYRTSLLMKALLTKRNLIAESKISLQCEESLDIVRCSGTTQPIRRGKTPSLESLSQQEIDVLEKFDRCRQEDANFEKARQGLTELKQRYDTLTHLDRSGLRQDVSMATVDLTLAYQNVLKARGEHLKSQISLLKGNMNRCGNSKERGMLQESINSFGLEMLAVHRDADEALFCNPKGTHELKFCIQEYMVSENLIGKDCVIADQTQIDEIFRLLNPLTEIANRKLENRVRFERSKTLPSLPGGRELEIEFQCDPQKFERINEGLKLVSRETIKERYSSIFGKKKAELTYEDRLRLEDKKIMTFTVDDLTAEQWQICADQHGCKMQDLHSIVNWRNQTNPKYFEKINIDLGTEVHVERCRPYTRDFPLRRWIDSWQSGDAGMLPGDSIPESETHANGIQLHRKVDENLVPLGYQDIYSNLEFIDDNAGIFKPQYSHKIKSTDEWVSLTSRPEKDATMISIFAPGRSNIEAIALWHLGPKSIVTYVPGINTTRAGGQADCLRLAEMSKAEIALVVDSQTKGLAIDALRASSSQGQKTINESALRLVQIWRSYFDINPKGVVQHWANSNGVYQTRRGLELMPEPLRDRIIPISLCPQEMIPKTLCKNSITILSDLDRIAQNALRKSKASGEELGEVFFLESDVKRDSDHTLRSQTYFGTSIKVIDKVNKLIEKKTNEI